MEDETQTPNNASTVAERFIPYLERENAGLRQQLRMNQRTFDRFDRQLRNHEMQIEAQVYGMRINRAVWNLLSNLTPERAKDLEAIALRLEHVVNEARGREDSGPYGEVSVGPRENNAGLTPRANTIRGSINTEQCSK